MISVTAVVDLDEVVAWARQHMAETGETSFTIPLRYEDKPYYFWAAAHPQHRVIPIPDKETNP